jgi:uncharacterized membrane protein
MSVLKIVKDILRRQFVSGVLVVVPLILTYVVLRFLFEAIDGILLPIIIHMFGYTIPGLGIIATLLIILLTGFFIRSIVGATLYKHGDRILARIPLIRVVYLAAKQLIEAITRPQIKSFKEVVMIEYPRRGLYIIGFATAKTRCVSDGGVEQTLVGVFVPSTPTPVSGFVVFVPEDEVTPLQITVEEAIKMLVSGGIVTPSLIRTSGNIKATTEIGERHAVS